jgi:hypothetical protein
VQTAGKTGLLDCASSLTLNIYSRLIDCGFDRSIMTLGDLPDPVEWPQLKMGEQWQGADGNVDMQLLTLLDAPNQRRQAYVLRQYRGQAPSSTHNPKFCCQWCIQMLHFQIGSAYCTNLIAP